MTGWSLRRACLVACLPGELSQHPTWPQVRQSRRWTHCIPVLRHSSQPIGVRGSGWGAWGTWGQVITEVMDAAPAGEIRRAVVSSKIGRDGTGGAPGVGAPILPEGNEQGDRIWKH